jgi:hypothetical protein
MSTWRPPWSAQGQFAVTLLPATRASNSVMARRPPGPGSTAALRAGSQDPAPRDLPADLGWPGGRPRRPRWAEPFRATPSQPSPTTAPSTTRAEDPGRRHPTRGDHSDPDRRVWRGRAAFALLGWGNNPSMAVPRRDGRRRAAGAGPMVRAFGDTRTCAEDGCPAQLSRYNPARRCAIHQGWDRQKVTRPRIRQQGHGRG